MTLSLPECRGGDWSLEDTNECFSDSRGFPAHLGCEINVTCYYGNSTWMPATAPCVVADDEQTRCGGIGPGGGQPPGTPPRFCVKLDTGYVNSEGLTTPIFSTNTWEHYPSGQLNLQIERCAPENTCVEGDYHAIWKTRTFVEDALGWELKCTEVVQCEEATDPGIGRCDQFVEDLTIIAPKTGNRLTYVRMGVGTAPHCFTTEAQFCLRRYCEEDEFDCVGNQNIFRVSNLDSLDVTLGARDGTVCQYTHSDQYEIRNAIWATLQDLVDRLDSPGHAPANGHDSPNIALWLHSETFGALLGIDCTPGGTVGSGDEFTIDYMAVEVASYVAFAGESYASICIGVADAWNASPDKGNIVASAFPTYVRLTHSEAETFTVTLNNPASATWTQSDVTSSGANPHVVGNDTEYSAYEGVDIPITMRGSNSGSTYSTATTVLTIKKVVASAEMFGEHGNDAYRIQGTVRIYIQIRVERDTGVAPGTYLWLNPSDPFDLRVEDPDDLGNEHPRERIMCTAPNGEKIWRQTGDGEDGHEMYWDGLKVSQSISRGPNDFDRNSGGAPCCAHMGGINATPILGKTNDNRGLDAEYFKVTTIQVLRADGIDDLYEIQLGQDVICSWVDSTGVIEDVIDEWISDWNGSAHAVASQVTASKLSTDKILLTPDEPDVLSQYAATPEINDSESNTFFEVTTERYTEFPQRYDGSVSFEVDFAGTGC